MTIYCGIDPGITGAVAFIDTVRGTAIVEDLPRHATEHRLDGFALAKLMRWAIPANEDACVWMELLHASVGHSGGSPAVGQAKMMQTYGVIQGAIDCTRIPLHYVRPQTWKKVYRLTRDKAPALELARRLYPDLQPRLKRAKDHNRAEAVLIAHYARATMQGEHIADEEILF